MNRRSWPVLAAFAVVVQSVVQGAFVPISAKALALDRIIRCCYYNDSTLSLWDTRTCKRIGSPIMSKANDNYDHDQEQMQTFLEDIEESNIDSFLRGDYDRPFAEDASAPHPGIVQPGAMLETALKDLRALDDPELNHGAAVFLRFCLPLSRSERWGGSNNSAWKEILRGALTPNMFSQRIKASTDFTILLRWQRMNILDFSSSVLVNRKKSKSSTSTTEIVSVEFYLGDDYAEKAITIQFVIQKYNGVWLIEDASPLS